MASDVQAVMDALAQGKQYERAERERRIGLTYAFSGLSIGLTFVTYGLLMLAPFHVPALVFTLAWFPFIVSVSIARRRFFRHIPTTPRDVSGMPPELWWLFVAAWIGSPFLLSSIGLSHLIWPMTGTIMGALYLTQAAFGRDITTAWIGVGAIAVSAATIALPASGYQALALGLVALTTLVILGIVRWRRA